MPPREEKVMALMGAVWEVRVLASRVGRVLVMVGGLWSGYVAVVNVDNRGDAFRREGRRDC